MQLIAVGLSEDPCHRVRDIGLLMKSLSVTDYFTSHSVCLIIYFPDKPICHGKIDKISIQLENLQCQFLHSF